MTKYTQNDSSVYDFDESDRTHPTEATERKSTNMSPTTSPTGALPAPANALELKKKCCICSSALTKYTCPECNRYTCSLNCINEHKHQYNCSGIPSVAKHVDLSDYTSHQMQRDYRFLENCKRVIDNAERSFSMPNVPHYKFHALPKNLRTLREEAGKRGVICQIMSEGMRKRDGNTSRYDRCNNTITWKCEFIFCPRRATESGEASRNHMESFSVSTDWANERHKLGDVMEYCWAINPPLPCFRINRKYNKVSGYVGHSTPGKGTDSNNKPQTHSVDTPPRLASTAQVGMCDTEQSTTCPSSSAVTDPVTHEEVLQGSFVNAPQVLNSLGEKPVEAEPLVPFVPLDPNQLIEQHLGTREKISRFLSAGRWAILAKAERLGNQEKYFHLNPRDTLNEALRVLFFINEYPVFIVVYEADLPHYPLVTSEDKEVIRESFRATDKRKVSMVDSADDIASGHLRNSSSVWNKQSWRQGTSQLRGSKRARRESRFSWKGSHEHTGQNNQKPRGDNSTPRSTAPYNHGRTT